MKKKIKKKTKKKPIETKTKPVGRMNLLAAGYDIVACPTLEELIDACEDKISHIKRLENGRWFAVSHNAFYECGNNIEEDGETPLESVAKLFIKLNTK